jgi:cation diffusion facilitator family transporter
MTSAYRQARSLAVGGMVVSVFLAALKISVGVAAGSAATVADGFESAADVLASAILILGLTIASRPADRNHPYGHGRYEILTGLAIGLVLCITGGAISHHTYLQIGVRQLPPQIYAT